jgi:hypothetical protein
MAVSATNFCKGETILNRLEMLLTNVVPRKLGIEMTQERQRLYHFEDKPRMMR